MITCPSCGSSEVRASRNARMTDAFHRLRGREPFRCRSCRRRFFAALPPAEKQRLAAEPKRSHGSKLHLSTRRRKRLIRLLIMISIFAVAFILFLFFLRYLTTERQPEPDSGTASPAPAFFAAQYGKTGSQLA